MATFRKQAILWPPRGCLMLFFPDRVAYPVSTVLDAPMVSPKLKKLRGVCFAGRKTGDGVVDFVGRPARPQDDCEVAKRRKN